MSTPHPSFEGRFSTGLAGIMLLVKDVLVSARFYQEVVGLLPQGQADEQWARFWAGVPGRSPQMALHKGSLVDEEYPVLPFEQRYEQVHYAFVVPRDKLSEAVGHVRAYGLGVFGPIHTDWMQAISYYFYDPDGNLLEFWSPGIGV